MKSILIVAALSAALFTLPVGAQQGPAGVPGVTDLVSAATAVVSPPPAPARQNQRASDDCSEARDTAQCKAREDARKKAQEACRNTRGEARKACVREQAQSYDCSKSRNPQRCENRKLAAVACKDVGGAQYKQCVQQKMPPAECSTAQDAARCAQHQKVRELCKDKISTEHRQCLRDNLVPRK